MEKDDNTLALETSSDIITRMLTDEKDGEEFTREFLKSSFLSSAVDALFHARRQVGLTQAQVAELMGTKQAAIARLEADTDGSMSLHRFVEFALACGMVPLDIKLAPIEDVHNYVLQFPEAPRTADAFSRWVAKNQPTQKTSGEIQVSNKDAQIDNNVLISSRDVKYAESSSEVFSMQASQQWESSGISTVNSADQPLTLSQPSQRQVQHTLKTGKLDRIAA